jgi:hypothetical protein
MKEAAVACPGAVEDGPDRDIIALRDERLGGGQHDLISGLGCHVTPLEQCSIPGSGAALQCPEPSDCWEKMGQATRQHGARCDFRGSLHRLLCHREKFARTLIFSIFPVDSATAALRLRNPSNQKESRLRLSQPPATGSHRANRQAELSVPAFHPNVRDQASAGVARPKRYGPFSSPRVRPEVRTDDPQVESAAIMPPGGRCCRSMPEVAGLFGVTTPTSRPWMRPFGRLAERVARHLAARRRGPEQSGFTIRYHQTFRLRGLSSAQRDIANAIFHFLPCTGDRALSERCA